MTCLLRRMSVLGLLAILLASCGGAAQTPAATQAPAAAPTEAPAAVAPTEAPAAEPTEAPAAAVTEAPAEAAATEAPAATEPAAATEAPVVPAAGGNIIDNDPDDGLLAPQPIPDGMFPLTQEKATLRVALPSYPSVEDFNTNLFTKWYEEKTNVHVEWIILPAGDEGLQKLNLMLSSGDIPDVIMGFYNITPALLQLYGQQGLFIPLNDLIDQYGTNVKNGFTQYPLAKEVATAPDGKIYGLPEINDCYHCSVSQKLWIYKPWLDKLGLKMPTTTDEFYEVLKAFKEKDPNGNGQADEVPLSSDIDGWNSEYDLYFMNSFELNPGNRLVVNNGKVEATYAKEEWREGLRYLNKLYSEGLLDPNSLTQDNAALMRLGQSDPVTLGAAPWGYPGGWAPIEETEGARWSQYVVVPPLKGPSGFQVQASNPYSPFTPGRFIITSAAKDPALAFKWGEAFYQQEVEITAYLGPQGIGWRWAKPGEKGIHGEQALYVSLKTWGNVQNDHWSQANVSFRSSDFRLGEFNKSEWGLEPFLYNQSKLLVKYNNQPNEVLPPLYFPEAQAQEVGEFESTLTKFRKEMTARFISGDASLDADWDGYLEALNQQGLPRYLEILQASYDARPK